MGRVYFIAVDGYGNCLHRENGKSYAIRDAMNDPQCVAVKVVEHIIKEEVVWTKEARTMTGFRASVEVNNAPNYELRSYVVARLLDGRLWFYGTWDDRSKAEEVASELGDNALVVKVERNE